ncbi:MAG: nitrite reductase large subunit NirB [Polyangiales bacterium]
MRKSETEHQTRVVVIGNGLVGHRFVEELRERDPERKISITVIGEEPRFAYDRVHLSAYFDGSSPEALAVATRERYVELDIDTRLGDRAERIDRAQRTVHTGAGFKVHYDVLVLATGSKAFVPPIANHDAPGCFVYRTLDDVFAIESYAKRVKRGVVIGGGLLGLEAARALKELGLETTVVEFAPRLMPMQLDAVGGRMLRGRIESLGVTVKTDSNSTGVVIDEQRRVCALAFADGSRLETDLVLFSAGIRPRDELARDSGLAIGARGGIVIDDGCRTNDEHIYAIGECALWSNRIFGLVGPGYTMARVAAARIFGEALAFEGADMSTKLKLMGVDVASFGEAFSTEEGARSLSIVDDVREVYKRVIISGDGKRLLGGMLVGDASDYDYLASLAKDGGALPASLEALVVAPSEGAARPQLQLSDAAILCSCNNVTKASVCSAIRDGAVDMPALKKCTKVATGCGGCAQLVTNVLKAELLAMGQTVSNAICEHFDHTRQEIYHLVRVGQIKTFSELIRKHGKGLGCEICKPVAASVFASTWNEHILEPSHAQLQDSNDYFLANIQKDGTYSVVPRVPGGEITPDGLIAIGQVAKKYDLYTKITGGQRIDLFGARAEQLPSIWGELIDAGFESGHAYGKSLRTVKSCVGSTWCRYGVQDSVGLAVRVELRYRGVRSPHKLKGGVSGCTRECAEAQGKDFGIIATEKGYNLYVCGNGGMKPAHAQLLAADLDEPTLIQMLDRFLMFYIRTADRLQRTSTWLNQLEGGMEYLKQVVVQDSLGIGAELEAEMQSLVDTYQCEWKVAVDDPEKRRRFRHFVNSDAGDDNVVFVSERGQNRPARQDERRLLRVVP